MFSNASLFSCPFPICFLDRSAFCKMREPRLWLVNHRAKIHTQPRLAPITLLSLSPHAGPFLSSAMMDMLIKVAAGPIYSALPQCPCQTERRCLLKVWWIYSRLIYSRFFSRIILTFGGKVSYKKLCHFLPSWDTSEPHLKWLFFRWLEKAILGGMPNARISTW